MDWARRAVLAPPRRRPRWQRRAGSLRHCGELGLAESSVGSGKELHGDESRWRLLLHELRGHGICARRKRAGFREEGDREKEKEIVERMDVRPTGGPHVS